MGRKPLFREASKGNKRLENLSSFKTYGYTSTNSKTFGGGAHSSAQGCALVALKRMATPQPIKHLGGGAHGSAQGCALAELGIQLGLAIV